MLPSAKRLSFTKKLLSAVGKSSSASLFGRSATALAGGVGLAFRSDNADRGRLS